MESRLAIRKAQRTRRAFRTRNRVRGTHERPRMSVMKSNKHLAVQVIDDEKGVTLFSASTLSKEMSAMQLGKKSKASARQLGQRIAELAKQHQVLRVVFDKGFYAYHGLLAELADAAREAGLQF